MLLIVETITWKPHLETGIEIALSHLAKGEQVVYVNLRGALPICEDASRIHALVDLPGIRLKRGARILREAGALVELARPSPSARRRAMAEAARLLSGCQTLDQVKALSFGRFEDIGWGVVSSVISRLQDADPSPRERFELFRSFLASSILAYEQSLALIERLRPQTVVLFNGRFATTRAVMRAADALGVKWLIHERGGSKDRYRLIDYIPHDFNRFQDEVRSSWTSEQSPDGIRFFEERRNRVERSWHSYTKNQATGSIPEFYRDSKIVSFFTSSEDEMASIGDQFEQRWFASQESAIRATAEAIRDIPGLCLCVRVHPHLALKSEKDRLFWDRLEIPGVRFIRASDEADSYAIIDSSYAVCTIGSTVGIEATYWGKPSLLLSRSFYDSLGVARVARNVEEIRDFLRDPQTFPREAALPFGAFLYSLGQRYVYYRAESLHRGSISGEYLDDSRIVRAVRWIRRKLHQALRTEVNTW